MFKLESMPALKQWLMTLLLILLPTQVVSYTAEQLLRNQLDPKLFYRTLQTPHFFVHYPEHLHEVGRRVAGVAEKSYNKVTHTLGSEPGPTHIVVIDQSDEPPIYTLHFPERQIFYPIALPQYARGLNQYADWHDWLLTHELTHVTQIDQRTGLYRPLSALMGSSMRPQITTPAWVKEGLAVYLETHLTPKGRGESSEYRMMMRTAHLENVLDDSFFARKDTVFTFDYKEWPWGVRPYLFGYFLIREMIAQKPEVLKSLLYQQSKSLPFAIGPALKAAGFETFDDLWKKTLESIQLQAQRELAEIRKKPVTALEFLTDTGHIYHGLVLSHDGKTLFTNRDHPDFENSVLQLSFNENGTWNPPVPLTSRASGYQISLSGSGRFLAFDQARHKDRFYRLSDLYIYDLKQNKIISVSPALRARDPDIHPDGKQIVYVKNHSGKNQLILTDTGWNQPKILLEAKNYSRISGPRFSPSGQVILFSLHNSQTGGEDLYQIDLNGKTKALIVDGFQNLFPSWVSEKKVIFSSDRTGVTNIYELTIPSGDLKQLSNVEGGFFFPVLDPQKKWIYGIGYHAKGYDVARFAVPTAPLTTQKATIQPEIITLEPANNYVESDYKGTKYLSPQYLAPSIVLRPGASQLGATLGAVDPLYFQHYTFDLRHDSVTQKIISNFYYFNGRSETAWDLSTSHNVKPVNGYSPLYEIFHSEVSAHFLSPRRNYEVIKPFLFHETRRLTSSAEYVGAGVQIQSDTTYKKMGASFAQAGRKYALQLSEFLSLKSEETSTSLSVVQIKSHHALRESEHVLHLSLDGAGFIGTQPGSNTFLTAGSQHSFPYALASDYPLYGAAPNSILTKRLIIGSAHYTFPLSDIERGLGASSFYFGRLSGALRTQIAGVPRENLLGDGLPWSVGAEIYQALDLGQVYALHLHLGIYQGSVALGNDTQILFTLSTSAPN